MASLRLSLLILALAGALALPGVATAGGWLVLTLDGLPVGEPRAGEEMTLGFTARQHGRILLAGVEPIATFVHPASGARVMVPGVDESAAGHYAVRFTPDRPGAWQWSIRAWNMDHAMPALTVAPAAPAIEAPAQPAPARAPLLAGSGVLALVGLLCLGLAWRRGRPATGTLARSHG